MTYNTVGHCFFLEDGIEHGNEFVHNLAIQIKCHTSKPCVPTNLGRVRRGHSGRARPPDTNGQQSKDVLLPSDNTVSAYWITNPDNTYRDNVAAGSDANGFWMSLPEHPNGAFQDSDASKATWPRRMQHSASSRATSPTRTTTASCSTGNIAANNTFGCDRQHRISAARIPLTRTARRWNRCSRISPPTRTAMAASGAAVRLHLQEREVRPTTPSALRSRLAAVVRYRRTRQRCLTRCSWAKPRTSATPALTRKKGIRPQLARSP